MLNGDVKKIKIEKIQDDIKNYLGNLGENWVPKFSRMIGVPPIIHDEAFSSWVARLSSDYGISVRSFLNIIGVKKQSHQIDIGHESLDLMKISTLVMCDPNLIAHLNWPVDSVLNKPNFLWLSFRGIYEEPIYQYCPKCLNSDSIPYFRQSWRIATNEICPIHSALLQISCPHCHKNINLSVFSQIAYPLKKTLLYCNKCRKSLAHGNLITVKSTLHREKLRKQQEIYELIKSSSSFWKSKGSSKHKKPKISKSVAEKISQYYDECINMDFGMPPNNK